MAIPAPSRLGGGPWGEDMALHHLRDLPGIHPTGRLAGSMLPAIPLMAAIPREGVGFDCSGALTAGEHLASSSSDVDPPGYRR